MKNTKENVIKLLEKMIANSRAVSKIFAESGDKEGEARYRGEYMALQEAMWLLEDEKFFNNQLQVFNKEAE